MTGSKAVALLRVPGLSIDTGKISGVLEAKSVSSLLGSHQGGMRCWLYKQLEISAPQQKWQYANLGKACLSEPDKIILIS